MGDPFLGFVILLAFAGSASGQAGGTGNFDLFRTRITEPANSYRLEFLEGDIRQNPSTTLERISGRMVVSQSQRQYRAIYQRSGFSLTQVTETVALGGGTNVLLFVDCGRNDTQGWVRRDSAFVRLVDMDIVSTNPTVLTIVDEVRRRENMVCCACFYGLPPMDLSEIEWDGLHFSAPAINGGVVRGTVSVDPANGLVSGVTYTAHDSQGRSWQAPIC